MFNSRGPLASNRSLFPICLLALAPVAGCAVSGDDSKTTRCYSAGCLMEEVKQPYFDACMRALTVYARSSAVQRAIDKEYGYPLTNAASYASFVRAGGRGPNPTTWCRMYADTKVRHGFSLGR